MKVLRFILLMFSVISVLPGVNAQAVPQIDKSKLRLSWNVDKLKLYDHEPAVVTLYLWTPEIEAQGVSPSKAPGLDKGEFCMRQQAEYDRRMNIVEKDGSRWFVYPVDSYAIAFDHKGKFNLKGGRYYVDLAVPAIYDDPFWGRVQTLATERVEVPVSPLEITVSALPDNRGESQFSGAVGEFNVSVTVPPGDIFLNEEAIAIVTVRGPGLIYDHTLPEYSDGFGSGTRLKSFSENRRQYVQEGNLVSEVELECTFIPTSKDNAVILPIKLEYFNPKTGKYESAESQSVVVNVKSIASKAPKLDI